MKRVLSSLMLALLVTARAEDSPWIELFNGRDLSGWTVKCKTQDRDKTFWKVEGGTILCDALEQRENDYVWLVSDREFGDFELRLKFQAYTNSPGNSGLQFRSRYDESADGGWLDGPQVDIHPPAAQSWRTGLIYDETRGERRWVSPSLKDAKIGPEHKPARHEFKYDYEGDGWNDLTLICRSNQVKTIVNGIVRKDWDGTGVLDNAAHLQHRSGRTGHFALQLHARNALRIRFKDIQVRELKE